MRIVVVRHAHAGDRDTWTGDDRLRPLTGKGWKQAAHVADLIEAEGVRRLVSSPYTRCRQTLEPAAERLGVVVEAAAELAEGAGDAVLGLLWAAREPQALCTHGDVLAELHGHLLEQGLTERRDTTAKGASWILEVVEGRITTAAYSSPG